jgi:type II secretory pathway component PulF
VARVLLVPTILTGVGLAVALRAWYDTDSGRRTLHAFLLGTPVVGTIRRCGASAHALSSLGALLESGVPIRVALTFTARSAGDAEIERRVLEARTRVASGHSLSLALKESDAVTVTAMRLIRAGEESGRLVGMMQHAAKLDQDHADRLTRAAVRLLEPMLILVFAGIVGLVSAALLQAVYSVRPS